jgi:hypothetical protein
MINIFADIKHELQEFDTYSTWFYYNKEGNVIGSHSIKERVLPVDQGIAMLFYPQDLQNRQTNSLCEQLGSELATCLILEIEDPRKANRDYFSIMDGKHSYAQVSDAEKEACMGLKAVNDPAESGFATFAKALNYGG